MNFHRLPLLLVLQVPVIGALGFACSSDPVVPGVDTGLPDVTTTVDAVVDNDAEATPDVAADVPECIAPSETVTGTLRVVADDEWTVWVNGTMFTGGTSWTSPTTHAVSIYSHRAKKNVIAIEGRNKAKQGGLDRGILAELVLTSDAGADAGTTVLVTDGSWKISSTATPDGGDAGSPASDWFSPTYNDNAWSAAVIAASHGDAPWGAVLGTSSAKWIWAYKPDGAAVDKTVTETNFARRTFYGAGLTSTPGACP